MKIAITTKTGDHGQSGLANGQRVGKEEQVFEVIGTLDELNSWLGLLAVKISGVIPACQSTLYSIQETLFYIGAEVAHSPTTKLRAEQVTQLESWQTELENQLAENWHTKFLLPGGTELGAYIDITRTVCRRCEREVIQLHRQDPVSPTLIQYINRLSDYLYLLRCLVNQEAKYSEKPFEAKSK